MRGDRRGNGKRSTNIGGRHRSRGVRRSRLDNIGTKTIPDYAAYAASHVYDVNIPGCRRRAGMFVGQRKDPFSVNLGEMFDLVNTNAVGDPRERARRHLDSTTRT